jgi:hypothetical protein
MIDFRWLAKEAGFRNSALVVRHHGPDAWDIMLASDKEIENFARLVTEAAAIAEREECARVCLETDPFYGVMFADAIRARGKE